MKLKNSGSKWIWTILTVTVASMVLVLSFILISNDKKTPLETDLLAVLLTAASGLIGWLISKYFAEKSASESLRDYGVQVARGVMVLQSQLHQLGRWISDKRVSAGDQIVDGQLDHIQEMLISFQRQSEATLNAIAGIIGEELKQYDDVLTQINKIRADALREGDALVGSSSRSGDESGAIGRREVMDKLDAIERAAEEKIAAISKRSALPVFDPLNGVRDVIVDCPKCADSNQISIGHGGGQTRSVVCRKCSHRFNVHTTGAGGLFTRSLGVAVYETQPIESRSVLPDEPATTPRNVTGGLGGSRGWAIWNLPFLAADFPALCRCILEADKMRIDAGQHWSINELNRRALANKKEAVVGIKLRKLVQICFYGRLFHFEGQAAFSRPYQNTAISRSEILAAISRYCCHQFFLNKPVPQESIFVSSNLLAFMSADLSPPEMDEIRKEIAREYANRLQSFQS